MANAQWPPSLPPVLFQNNFQAMEANAISRSKMDVGPAKVRRRVSNDVRPVKGTLRMDNDQYNTFTAFFRTTLLQGALPFDWVEALPGGSATVATYRFVTPPQYNALSSGHDYEVALDLEILP